MNITLYKMLDVPNKVNKTLGTSLVLTGNVRGDCSMTDPIIEIANATMDYTYAYITQFSRYYFIKSATIMRTGLWRLELHVDVLQSNASAIKALTAIVKRQQNVYNLYLDDPLFKAQNKQQIITKRIGSSAFTPSTLTGTPCFVLTVVGG